MKKFFMIAIVAAATISFSACNSKTDGASKSGADSATVATPVTPAQTSTSGDVLDKYADLVEKAILLQEKAKTGDAAALQEMANLGQEMASMATEIQNSLTTMTPEQTARFNELAKRLVPAAVAK